MDLSDDLTINEIIEKSGKTAKEKGFRNPDEPRSLPEDIALMHSELSEALESYRESTGDDWKYLNFLQKINEKPTGVWLEFADTVIRICETCHHYNINLEQIIRNKMHYNTQRAYKHGGKKI